MWRFLLVSSVLLAVAAASPAKSPTFNVDFDVGWGRCYRPMEWTPVGIGVSSNLKKPFDAVLTISAQQDDLTRMTIRHEFVLTPDLPRYMPMVTKFAFAAGKCEVRIREKRGRRNWSHAYELWSYGSSSSGLKIVNENELLIGLVGRRGFGLSHLQKYAACRSPSGSGSGRTYLKQKLPRRLPWDWTGYACLDLLVLYDPDWRMINTHQARAIAQWVGNGGKLVVVLGGHPLPREHPIAELLPFEFGQPKQVAIRTNILRLWGSAAAAGTTVVCLPARPKKGTRLWRAKNFGSEEPLFVTAFKGFGRVGVVTFDPSVLKVRRPTDAVRFWVGNFAALLGDSSDQAGQRGIRFEEDAGYSDSDDSFSYETGLAGKGANAVLEHLLSIPELRPLSIWWVIGLLVLLAVLLGPVDYFILKALDRQPLTWVTSAVLVAVFTVGAYYGVQALRAGAMQLRVVSVLDAVEGDGNAWSTTYSGLFAPASDDYHLANLQNNQWWSGIAPTESSIWAHNRETAGRNIYCYQHDGRNLPYSLPINIWSMQCLLCESPGSSFPITATVKRSGRETVVRIVNMSDHPIRRGCVRFGANVVMRFGSVPAQSTEVFRGRPGKGDDWAKPLIEEYYTPSFATEKDTAYFAQGCLRRSCTIEAYLKRGAAVVCAEYDGVPVSFSVADRKCDTNHVRLVRLVVFPKEDG